MANLLIPDRKVTLTPINDDITLLDDNGEATCYIVRGTEQALVIDTANGAADIADYARQLTSLPLTVVNTHGHGDHVLGNVFFKEVYLHPADWALHDEHANGWPIAEQHRRLGLKLARLLPLDIGHVFDLGGGLTLEVIPLPGHTPGSIGLLDRKHRILFTGDGLNSHCWMQPEESLPIADLIATLEAVEAKYRKDYDFILTGHGKGPEPADITERLLACAKDLAAGHTQNDAPYEWFMGMCHFHRFLAPSGEGEGIVYGPTTPKEEMP